jgi:isoleucyl-tRNA synthetase
VHPDLEYVKLQDEASQNIYILLGALLKSLYKDPKKAKYKILEKFKGSHMLGWKYTPPFPYFYEKFKDYAFKVVNDKYVTADSGVGIVHQSPAFGEEDYRIGLENGYISDKRLPPNPVDDNGCFTSEVTDFAGMYVKDADKPIMKYLKDSGRLVSQATFMHSYPFCWRSDTPLIYRAVSSWFIKVSLIAVTIVVTNVNRSRISFLRCWTTLRRTLDGFPVLSKKTDSHNGSNLPKIGMYQEIDILEPRCQYGQTKIILR